MRLGIVPFTVSVSSCRSGRTCSGTRLDSVPFYGINLIGSRCGKPDAARDFVNRNVIVCFCIPLTFPVTSKSLPSSSRASVSAETSAVLHRRRLKQPSTVNRESNGEIASSTARVEIIRCFDRIWLIAQEQLYPVIFGLSALRLG